MQLGHLLFSMALDYLCVQQLVMYTKTYLNLKNIILIIFIKIQ